MRLVIDMVVALVASLIAGTIAVMVVARDGFDDDSITLGLLAGWGAALVFLPLLAFAASRRGGRRSLFRVLRVLVAVPVLMVVALRFSEFAGVRPAWTRMLSGKAEITVLTGVVATLVVQGIIFMGRAGRSARQAALSSPRFGRRAHGGDQV